jgi:hypothetical protein
MPPLGVVTISCAGDFVSFVLQRADGPDSWLVRLDRRCRPKANPLARVAGQSGNESLVRCSAAPLLLHDDRRADPDPVIEIDHVLIGQANAAR